MVVVFNTISKYCEGLTLNKQYNVIFSYPELNSTEYRILNDNNIESYYNSSMFITIEVYRERQIDKILKKIYNNEKIRTSSSDKRRRICSISF